MKIKMIKDFYQLHLQFQNFMKDKGYSNRRRESLISPIFPTTFTMSGGPDLVYKFWHGDNSLEGNHIVNQPCIRHWDIDLTGDSKHLSFFNMFVADSINGFSRKEVISHFFEFFTKQLNLDSSKFYASYFGGGNIKGTYFVADNEMKEIYISIGIKPEHIFSSSKDFPSENFVANSVEPVGGPRAELFYDIREKDGEIRSDKEFWELEKEGKVLEFFTHVLYNIEVKTKEIKNKDKLEYFFKNMTTKVIAAGFGPQRLLRIFENVDDIGDISVFKSLKNCFDVIPDNLHKESVIVSDHIRGLVFLINDGVLDLHGNKNRSRRYLFRKYMKNFKSNFDKLVRKNKENVIKCLVRESTELFSILFPSFSDNNDKITDNLIKVYNEL